MSSDSAVLDLRQSGAGSDDGPRTYSLVEVAQQTGIPMPILLRYKRENPDRVPSQGSGSQQRFPEQAFDAFLAIQREEGEGRDLPRRGGFGLLSLPKLRRRPASPEPEEAPNETPAAVASPATAAVEARAGSGTPDRRKKGVSKSGGRRKQAPGSSSGLGAGGELLTLSDVGERLGIPYPTVARYASQFEDLIPHRGKGRSRRFPPEAVAVFERIRRESKPGRPPKGGGKGPRAHAAASPPRPEARPRFQAAPRPTAPGDVDGSLARRIHSLERSQQILEEQIRELLERLSRPISATVEVI
jgi:DNA-binding transcriptional MerR regulator